MIKSTHTTLEKLLSLSARAYCLGEQDQGKQRAQDDVFNAIGFNLRNGYKPAVWQAYKAGRFAATCGDN